MTWNEILGEALNKTFLKTKQKKEKLSLDKNNPNIEKELTSREDQEHVVKGFFDDGLSPLSYSLKAIKDQNTKISKQNDLITEYRRISSLPEVSNAIDEIINEMSFVVNNKDVVYINIRDEANMRDSTVDSIIQNFNEILSLMDFNYNVDHLCRRFYIDGQLNLGLSYDNNNIRKGIRKISLLSPLGLVRDPNKMQWAYSSVFNVEKSFVRTQKNSQEQSDNFLKNEELVHIDSGLYSEGVILSHLHNAIKVANQLQTLEDLLIPLRFSRSISRRVFNIEVGNLPYSKALQAVQDIQNQFKYKKYYDVEKGTIANSSIAASIVEDYYIPTREGKGTSIDVLDETGNLGEMGDIIYFQQKLYTALKVPLGRIAGADKGAIYDFSATQIENDEIRFFSFINRLRQRFNTLFIELLKRHMVAKGLFTTNEFEEYKKYIYISWEKESNFLERQTLDLFKQRIDLYSQAKDYIGDIFSKKYVLKNILRFSDEEIEQMKEEMLEEAGEGEVTPPEEVPEKPEQEEPEQEEEPEKEEPEEEPEQNTSKQEEEPEQEEPEKEDINKEEEEKIFGKDFGNK